MKFFFALLAIIIFHTSNTFALSIISDFDDTIKRSNIPNRGLDTVRRALAWKKVYYGMPELFQQLDSQVQDFYILSASPSILERFVEKSLSYYEIPYDYLITRNLITERDIKAYKLDKIRSILDQSHDDFVLIGDDSEKDPETFSKISKEYPSRIKSIYIHKVLNQQNLPQGITTYLTAFDLALSEYKEGRLTYRELERVAGSIIDLSSKDMKKVIPDYAYCPKKPTEFTYKVPLKVIPLNTRVVAKLIKHCLLR